VLHDEACGAPKTLGSHWLVGRRHGHSVAAIAIATVFFATVVTPPAEP
jgi:hypothetical protein